MNGTIVAGRSESNADVLLGGEVKELHTGGGSVAHAEIHGKLSDPFVGSASWNQADPKNHSEPDADGSGAGVLYTLRTGGDGG